MSNPPPPSATVLRAQIQEVKRIRKHAVSIIKNGGAEGALANLTRDVCDVLLALIPHAVGEEPNSDRCGVCSTEREWHSALSGPFEHEFTTVLPSVSQPPRETK